METEKLTEAYQQYLNNGCNAYDPVMQTKMHRAIVADLKALSERLNDTHDVYRYRCQQLSNISDHHGKLIKALESQVAADGKNEVFGRTHAGCPNIHVTSNTREGNDRRKGLAYAAYLAGTGCALFQRKESGEKVYFENARKTGRRK